MINVYIDKLRSHYKQYFGISGIVHKIDKGPINKHQEQSLYCTKMKLLI